ncbi:MAG: hypothetical protein QXH55_03330 [Candidatus Korarchaeota archaeon]|nr:hypothetical protein [Thermoproteota archaeon]MCR8463195.1 hypothetical protein [Thermoproteota archaeon]MCR8470560.1 hypothetical protein [Thermoproteota archaeon]MCR8472240.1 hypothetical protein [Thermoproteota archaeon]MCR8473085.1 hypothetical protein [Thermoproteota archaeon]
MSKEYTVHELKLQKQTLAALESAGIYYIKDILLYSPTRLAEITGLSKETCEKILDKAIEFLDQHRKRFMPIAELEKTSEKKRFMSTGAHALNRLLQGGWCVGEVTELAGPYGSGKSQACFTALATVFLPSMSQKEIQEILQETEQGEARKGNQKEHWGLNDGDISAVIIDSERTFSVNRFKKIIKRFNLDEKEVMKRIIISRPENAWDQKRIIESLVSVVRENNAKLVVVDSLTKLPRADFSGQGELYARQRLILDMAEKLRRIAINYEAVVLVTNQVVASVGTIGLGFKPTGGHVLGHTVDTRLLLVRATDPYRRVSIMDSSWLPPGECKIKITDEGIADA